MDPPNKIVNGKGRGTINTAVLLQHSIVDGRRGSSSSISSPTTPTSDLRIGLKSIALNLDHTADSYLAADVMEPWRLWDAVQKKALDTLWLKFESAAELMSFEHSRAYLTEHKEQRVRLARLEDGNHQVWLERFWYRHNQMANERTGFISHMGPISTYEKRADMLKKDLELSQEEHELEAQHEAAIEQLRKGLVDLKATQQSELKVLRMKYEADKQMLLDGPPQFKNGKRPRGGW